jgi:hypothetical protein
MTIAIILILASLLIIGILRTVRESRGETPAEQVTESTVQAEALPEPQAEIIIENPPHQAPAQKKSSPAKKAPAKKAPAKKTTPKK